jgi:hypothetical protein
MKKLPTTERKRDRSFLQSGQALILLLLTLSVVLVVSLSIASRSIVDIATVGYEEDAQRAFSAAEAGVEEVLNNPSLATGGFSVTLDNDTTVEAIIPTPVASVPSGHVDGFIYPHNLASGESATFYLASKDTNGQFKCGTGFPCVGGGSQRVRYCWGNKNTTQNPAIVISTYYDNLNPAPAMNNPNDYSNVKVVRLALASSATDDDSFVVVGAFNDPEKMKINGQEFHRCVTVRYRHPTLTNLA